MPKYLYSKETNGFYIEGINANIPENSVEISKEYYDKLFEEISKDDTKVISGDENNMPIVKINLSKWKEKKRLQIKEEFNKIINTPINFKGKQFLPKDIDTYVSLINRHEDNENYDLWDNSDKLENILSVSNTEVKELIKILSLVYEQAYQNKKIKIAQIESMTSVEEN